MAKNFSVPYSFIASTADSPKYVKASEVNMNFNCITQVLADTIAGHHHDNFDSRLVDIKSGIGRICSTDGITAITFSVPFQSGLSFCVIASALSNVTAALLTSTSITINSSPWHWNNAGFTMTALWSNTTNRNAYNALTNNLLVQWLANPFIP